MPRKGRKPKTTYSFQIKRGKKFMPIPRFTPKQKRDILLGLGKFKKLPALFAVKRIGKKIVKRTKLG